MTIDLMTLLLIHFICNAQAEIAPISVNEARFCSSNFESLKVRFHPDFAYEDFEKRDEKSRSIISVESYGYYKNWLDANPGVISKLRDASILMLSVRDN